MRASDDTLDTTECFRSFELGLIKAGNLRAATRNGTRSIVSIRGSSETMSKRRAGAERSSHA
jgi:hypothetical protein